MTFMQDLWIETLTKILLSADIPVLSLEGFQDICRKKWENLVGLDCFVFVYYIPILKRHYGASVWLCSEMHLMGGNM